MKYQVDSERTRQVEFKSDRIDQLADSIWAEELVIKFMGWSVGTEMLC